MALDSSNSSNLGQLALKGLTFTASDALDDFVAAAATTVVNIYMYTMNTAAECILCSSLPQPFTDSSRAGASWFQWMSVDGLLMNGRGRIVV